MEFPRLDKNNYKKTRYFFPDRNCNYGHVKSVKFFMERQRKERDIKKIKGDNEITNKVLNKYKYYFDDYKGEITGLDFQMYYISLMEEIEKEEKK